MRALACLLGVLACAALAAGCGDDDDSSGGGSSDNPTRLVVSAASSMTEALEQCAPEFGDAENADVKLSFAGSDELAAQIRQGAPVDVYAAANTKLPDQLNADGLLVYPWEIAIEPADEGPHGSSENRLPADVMSVTTVGSRVRVALGGAQPLVAEVTQGSAERLQLKPGVRVIATWKAAATRLVGL
jgi:molybdopterin-binding protein